MAMHSSLLRRIGFRRRQLGWPIIRIAVRWALRAGLIPPSTVNGAELSLRFGVSVNDVKFLYAVHDESHMDPIGATLFWRSWRDWEPAVVPLFARWAKEGGHVVDVGANTGFYTLLAAASGCTVTAFEPNPVVFNFLTHNIEINHFEQKCAILPYACGSESGKLSLFIHEDPTMCSAVFPSEVSHSVPVRRVDECTTAGQRVALVKIDAEGFELEVMRGMTRLLAEDRPKILFECFRPETAQPIAALLGSFGYSLHWIDTGGKLKLISEIDVTRYGAGEHNFAALC